MNKKLNEQNIINKNNKKEINILNNKNEENKKIIKIN